MKIQDSNLHYGNQTFTLPELSFPTTVELWRVPEAYRDSGYFVGVVQHGMRELPGCSLRDAELIGSIEYPASEAAVLTAMKAARLQRINAETDNLLKELSAQYPEREVLSWDQQLLEAQNAEAPRPLLQALATARGIDLDELTHRVLAKAQQYALASGTILGVRQRLEDLLDAAQTQADLHLVPGMQEALHGNA